MFFKKQPKAPFFDRLTGTTNEKIASYVEAHKDRQDILVESSILLLAMGSAGYFLRKELPSTLAQTHRDVLAFEVFVFSFHLLHYCFDALDGESDAASEAFSSA